MPERIQLQRRKGWRKPPGAVHVARPTRWGNPFRVGVHGDAAQCVARFEAWLKTTPEGRHLASEARRELRGHDLACWCSLDGPCHADVLLRIANQN